MAAETRRNRALSDVREAAERGVTVVRALQSVYSASLRRQRERLEDEVAPDAAAYRSQDLRTRGVLSCVCVFSHFFCAPPDRPTDRPSAKTRFPGRALKRASRRLSALRRLRPFLFACNHTDASCKLHTLALNAIQHLLENDGVAREDGPNV